MAVLRQYQQVSSSMISEQLAMDILTFFLQAATGLWSTQMSILDSCCQSPTP